MRLTSIRPPPTAASSLSLTTVCVHVYVRVPVCWLKRSRLKSDVEFTLQGNTRGSPHCSPASKHQPYSFLFLVQAQPVTAVATHLGCPRDQHVGYCREHAQPNLTPPVPAVPSPNQQLYSGPCQGQLLPGCDGGWETNDRALLLEVNSGKKFGVDGV